jgi:hypothetical protein
MRKTLLTIGLSVFLATPSFAQSSAAPDEVLLGPISYSKNVNGV